VSGAVRAIVILLWFVAEWNRINPPRLQTITSDGRTVAAYRALDGSVQPLSAHGTCLSLLQTLPIDSQAAWYRQPPEMQAFLRHVCTAADVQAAEEGLR
jgi:hypothetical protein